MAVQKEGFVTVHSQSWKNFGEFSLVYSFEWIYNETRQLSWTTKRWIQMKSWEPLSCHVTLWGFDGYVGCCGNNPLIHTTVHSEYRSTGFKNDTTCSCFGSMWNSHTRVGWCPDSTCNSSHCLLSSEMLIPVDQIDFFPNWFINFQPFQSQVDVFNVSWYHRMF